MAPRMRSLAASAVAMRVRRLLGRVVAPEVGALRQEAGDLRETVGRLERELADLTAGRDRLQARIDVLDADLDESRRLNVRLAELTDLVTEVVLPLHDREIDIDKLRPHDVEPQ